MDVTLSADVRRLIEERLEASPYESADHLVREALEVLRGRDDEIAPHKEAWRTELNRRYDEAVSGEVEWVDGDEAFRRLRERHEADRRQRS